MTKAIKDKIDALSALRGNSEIILYFTSDKQPDQFFRTVIASDIIPLFNEHLSKIGKKTKISLFIYSMGGFIETPWPLVNLIREYCDEFEVIAPDKALSAATLISLGADHIVMLPASSLSPVDPSGEIPISEKIKKNIQVEDISGFIDFTKEKYGITKQELLFESLKLLSSEIPPSFLGSIYRTQKLISSLTGKLLDLHKIKLPAEKKKVVIEKLTKDLFAHNHFINRHEAKEDVGLGNIIVNASATESKLINEIYRTYRSKMDLDKEFNPKILLGDATSKTYSVVRSIIDSKVLSHTFVSKYEITKVEDKFNVFNSNNNWVKQPVRR